ncbi:MAG: hypothetical protein AAFX50_14610 [Acidobacteriota bacterium]
MRAPDRWRELCELLFAVAPGVELVGAHDSDGSILAVVSTVEKPEEQLAAIKALTRRISTSSPLDSSRSDALLRASFTIGGQRLLVRSLSGRKGHFFVLGAPGRVTSSAWLLLDAAAVLGGALQSQSRPEESLEKS